MKYEMGKQGGGHVGIDMFLMHLRLECLYTEFLLLALLANPSGISRQRLITTADEIVSLVLLPTRKREILEKHRPDMEWGVSE